MNKIQESSSIPTVVLGHMESLSNLMGACDLLVTKGGGLTTFEAVARRLPMALDLLTESMPQESGTIKMLIDAKLAKPFRRAEDLVAIVNTLKPVDDREIQALPLAHNLDQVDAIFEISQTILDLLPKHLEGRDDQAVPILKH
jgi:UDP-N-acetylglucosamine:LPS N-acetylglucosamine transferase